MIEIEKHTSGNNYHFIIKTDTGNLNISFENNFDLYWAYTKDEKNNNDKEEKIIITKENFFLYELFYKLFNSIKNNNIYFSYYNDITEEIYKNNESIHNLIFHDNIIEFRSDDFIYEEASFFTIEEKEENYIVTFNKSKNKDLYQTSAVRISNSGSRYNYFNIPFMQMYHSLINYEPEYHQIHIEEYIYQRKKVVKLEKK